jgi:hypothetical protein
LEEIIAEFLMQFMPFSGYTQNVPTTTVMEKGPDVCFAIKGDEVRISGAIFTLEGTCRTYQLQK